MPSKTTSEVTSPSNNSAQSIKRLLVIDDDAYTRSLILATLKKPGRIIHDAATAIDALHMAREIRPDILILDLGLPGIFDGFCLLEALEREEEFRKLQVLIVSGWGDEEDIQRAKRLGAEAFIVKPFQPSTLAKTIDHLESRIEDMLVVR